MKTKFSMAMMVAAALVFIVACKSSKNSSDIKVTVTNLNAFAESDQAITMKVDEIKKKFPEFDISKTVVYSGDSIIPSQINDIDADGNADELVFVSGFGPQQTKVFSLRQMEDGTQAPAYKKRTQAELSIKEGGKWEWITKNNGKEQYEYKGGTFKNVNYLKVPEQHTDHSFFIRYEGPGWESDKVGYRFYLDWRNAIDIFGKKTDTMALQRVGLDGFDSYHEPAPWGQDIFKVGPSLGVGSIAMWANGKVNMVSKTDSVTCRIALNGVVESMVETNYYGWQVGDKKCNLRSTLSIDAGSRITKNSLYLTGDTATLCTGIVMHPGVEFLTKENPGGWTYLASWGLQSLANDSLGIAVLVKTEDLKMITEDSLNKVAVLKVTNNKLDYYLLAAWEKEPGGITTKAQFKNYLDKQVEELNNPVKVEY